MGAVKRALWKWTAVRSLAHLRRARRDVASLDPTRPGQAPVLVYQMAKVGSSTVEATLRALDPPRRPCLKVHFLSEEGARRERAYDRQRGGPLYVSYYGALAVRLGARLRRLGGALRLPVISLVRDPIAREVSGLFQIPDFREVSLRDRDGALDPTRIVEYLEERLASGGAAGAAERWFDEELRRVFDVDVFAEPFPRERGWDVRRSRSARVLLLRTEDLDRTLGPALARFLDLPKEPAVVRANERSASPDAAAYAEVRSRLRLHPALVDEIYAQRLPRHFYDAAMLDGFRRRWARA
ncbi:MAG: putative capsular polysaccharide synthesis family protein [Myxococcota bacterium]